MFVARLQPKHACQGRGHLDWTISALRHDVPRRQRSNIRFSACLNTVLCLRNEPKYFANVCTGGEMCAGMKKESNKNERITK